MESEVIRRDRKCSGASDAKKGFRIFGPDGLRRDMLDVSTNEVFNQGRSEAIKARISSYEPCKRTSRGRGRLDG